MTAVAAAATPERLPVVGIPRYPDVRHRDAFDRDYLLDVAAAATARTSPGSLPASWPLLDSREHVEAICRDYGDLDADHRFAAEQLDDAKRRTVDAERARDQAHAALAELAKELASERERHATTTQQLSASRADATRFQTQNLRLLAELALTRLALTAIHQRYQALQLAFVTADVLEDLRLQCRATREERHGGPATAADIDDTRVIDVGVASATGGTR